MTGLQKFIMELQQVASGTEVWNSTYEFAKGIGIKQERQRVVELIAKTKTITSDQAFFLIKTIEGE